MAAVGQRASGSIVVAPTGKQALLEILPPNFLSYSSSHTPSAVLKLPGELVAAAFLTRDGHEFVVVALADRTVHLLRFADEQRCLERCAELHCCNPRNSSPNELTGIFCARDYVFLLSRHQKGGSPSELVIDVLNIENCQFSHNDTRKLITLRAFTGFPAGTLVHVAAVAQDNNQIALINPSQNVISIF